MLLWCDGTDVHTHRKEIQKNHFASGCGRIASRLRLSEFVLAYLCIVCAKMKISKKDKRNYLVIHVDTFQSVFVISYDHHTRVEHLLLHQIPMFLANDQINATNAGVVVGISDTIRDNVCYDGSE
mmetsp:Transcript_35005/g.56525  ORF Transcript_35005/g.56525 Transcript_35005/m.56525 type:complete len:125 (-) Transcript_35005:156-530(-)